MGEFFTIISLNELFFNLIYVVYLGAKTGDV